MQHVRRTVGRASKLIGSTHSATAVRQTRCITIEPVFDASEIPKQKIPTPEKDKPEPAYYYGPEIIKAAYVLDRIPLVTRDSHPVEQDFEAMKLIHDNYYSANRWTDFWEFFEEWKKVKNQRDAQLGKKGAKKVRPMDLKVEVPDQKQPTTREELISAETRYRTGDSAKMYQHLLRAWNPAPRITRDDMDDNRKSLNRKLQNRLYLLFRNKQTGKWQFPEAVRQNPESIRMTAERCFEDELGSRVVSYFISNAPVAHYVNPQNPQEKTFFFHCLYLEGRPPFEKLVNKYSDHAWVTRKEIRDDYSLIDDQYKDVVCSMLWDGYDIV